MPSREQVKPLSVAQYSLLRWPCCGSVVNRYAWLILNALRAPLDNFKGFFMSLGPGISYHSPLVIFNPLLSDVS